MATIYRPTRADPATGKRIKYRFWRIAYVNENGKRVTVKGYKDKSATQAKARAIEQRIERIKAGLPVADETTRAWSDSVEGYLAELQRRGSPPDGPHVRELRRQLTVLANTLKWSSLTEAKAASLEEWLAKRAVEGMAPRTSNHYLTRTRAFLNWCVDKGWLAINPLQKLKPLKIGQKGRRRLRRAYTDAEMAALLASVPDPRRTIYAIASMCGLRRKELTRLTKEDCTPIGPSPHWHLRPEIDKAGRGDRVPMLPDCADLLKPLWEGAKPGARIFRNAKGRTTIPYAARLRDDLAKAGIASTDIRGRHADFHSFRYTFCSTMGRTLPIQKVKVLMRHSTITLTADLYLDLGIDDTAEGVWTLQRLFAPIKPGALPPAQTPA
jgi:integrase